MRLGILGGGQAVEKALSGIAQSKHWEVCRVWCMEGELIGRIPPAARVGSVEDVLASDADAVYIATPTGTHFDLAMKAIGFGKSILIEKPLHTLPVNPALRNLAGTNGFVGVGFKKRFSPCTAKAQELIASSTSPVNATFVWHNPPRPDSWHFNKEMSGGGVLMDLGSHVIDLFSFLLGKIIGASARLISRSASPEIDLETIAEVRFAGGHRLHMELSWLRPTRQQQFSIESDTGILSWRRIGNGADLVTWSKNGEADQYPSDAEYTLMFEQFGLASSGAQNRMPDINDGIANLGHLELLYRAGEWTHE